MIHPSPVTREGAQHAAQHELSKAIYHRNSDPLAVRAVRGFGHLIDRALNAALKHAPSGSLDALAVVVIVFVVSAVGLIVWRVGLPRRSASQGAVLASGRPSSAADHRTLSEHAADRADYHTAVIERMRAIARELEERSVLDARAGRTATELAREAGRVLPNAGGALGSAADVFNAIAYGEGAADASDVEVMVIADDLVRQSVRSKVLAA
jgi:hypothetical protein